MSKHINMSGLKTLLEPLVHLINKKAERPDWNENDINSPSYITNRPFYTEKKDVTIFNKSLYFDSNGEVYYEGESIDHTPFLTELILGETYTVIWDGVEYSCVAYQDLEYVYIGNIEFPYYLYDWEIVGPKSNEPFFITTCVEPQYGYAEIGLIAAEGSHSIKIIGPKINTTKIEEKYLPRAIGKQGQASGSEIFNDYIYNTAEGLYSHAEGNETTAIGDCSHAEGLFTNASGGMTHAEGCQTDASGLVAHAEGFGTSASGPYSHAEGGDTRAIGSYSHAEGRNTEASQEAHAEGKDTVARGAWCHAEGCSTYASSSASHSEGFYSKAYGNYSHAEGYSTTAHGSSSHTEGKNTKTLGESAHAEGEQTSAGSSASHAEGFYTIANSWAQHVQGKSNLEDSIGTYAHIVGNGTTSQRSNAHTLDWNGNAWFSGDVYVGSTSGTNKDEGSKKLATEEYVSTAIAAIPTPDVSGQIAEAIEALRQEILGGAW